MAVLTFLEETILFPLSVVHYTGVAGVCSKEPCMVKLPGCILAFILLYGKASSSRKGALLSSTLDVAMTQQTVCVPKDLLPVSNEAEHRWCF